MVCFLVLSPLRGATGEASPDARGHWAFQPLREVAVPGMGESRRARTAVDRFILARLAPEGLTLSRSASRDILLRRVAFLVTGLPPTLEESRAYASDRSAGATDRMLERYLESPRYAERWAKHWLDAAGYADSNGYFNADTDRPLAYRYRDYVIRAFRANKPFDQFVREQVAGDELSGWQPGQPVTPRVVELLEATHFLRNGPDGSGESDGNPDEVRADRYYALESALQIAGSSLLGMTVQCAKCHDHKFEPLSQREYYQWQAFFYPAFPVENWLKPNERVVTAAMPDEVERWQGKEAELDRRESGLRREFAEWIDLRRPRGELLFQDSFQASSSLAERWSATAPGDDAPGGSPPVAVDRNEAPGAVVVAGQLQVLEGGGSGDRWLTTRAAFSWRPEIEGAWVQASFELVAVTNAHHRTPAERVGYFIAAHDFNDSGAVAGGNVLLDGNPSGPTAVHVDYPGSDETRRGVIGGTPYRAGHRYGVRVTRGGADSFLLQHLVDGVADGEALRLKSEDLPDGAFGFEYCCGRGFVVDGVEVERSRSSDPAWRDQEREFEEKLATQRRRYEDEQKQIAAARSPHPGRIAWVTDRGAEPPVVPLLKRGNPKTPGAAVEPGFPAFLEGATLAVSTPAGVVGSEPRSATSTGRRRAWAEWLTQPGSRQSALLARVTVNRIWQHYFGVGIVATPENLGRSGAVPSHPELLEWLAGEFVRSGWDQKVVHRHILRSAVFQQSSRADAASWERDPSNERLSRFPLRRLDAEAWRDAVLAVSGRLDLEKVSGPYVPTQRSSEGEVGVDEARPDAWVRSVFLQQRRTQVPTLLGVFDAPSLVVNCTRRASTTMPLQSLALLNSEFVVRRAQDFAQRLERECGVDEAARLGLGYRLAWGREPGRQERREAAQFLAAQRDLALGTGVAVEEAGRRAWADLCQSWLAANEFLYLE
ncbi:MAG: DUF1553 domain-containing protein [Verrucomicrobiales bacterium]|nr:DUF1553 domain-containing protein [Verrucomicrobiales bacterium]